MAEVTKKRTTLLVRPRAARALQAPVATSTRGQAGIELERRERQLAALYELWRSAPQLEMERLLQLVAERVTRAMDAHTCSVLLRERGTDVLRLVASVGLPSDVADSVTLLVGERIAGRVAATCQPILVNRDPNSHPLLANAVDEGDIRKRPEVESALCAPLLGVTEGALGVLCLSRHAPAAPYSESDLRVFSLFAAQAGAVIAQRQTIDDLTRAAQEQAVLEREMERSRALAAMGQLAAMIAHELRNPLGSIKGAAQFLLQGSRDETIKDFLNIVVEEVDGLGVLTSDLLEFARPPAVECTPQDLVGIVNTEVAFLQRELATLGVVRVVPQFSVAEAWVQADVGQLSRVLRNLLLNAAQAMAAVSNARVESQIQVRVQQESNFWVLSVADNGPGLPSAEAERLWEPFFTTKVRGTGLGLAQVKKTIEAHGGEVEAHNLPTGGACFVLKLPIMQQRDEESQ